MSPASPPLANILTRDGQRSGPSRYSPYAQAQVLENVLLHEDRVRLAPDVLDDAGQEQISRTAIVHAAPGSARNGSRRIHLMTSAMLCGCSEYTSKSGFLEY